MVKKKEGLDRSSSLVHIDMMAPVGYPNRTVDALNWLSEEVLVGDMDLRPIRMQMMNAAMEYMRSSCKEL